MVAVRALQRRVAKLEVASRPRRSPISILFGSIDEWVDRHVIPDIEAGKVCPRDMADIVAAIRAWDEMGHYNS